RLCPCRSPCQILSCACVCMFFACFSLSDFALAVLSLFRLVFVLVFVFVFVLQLVCVFALTLRFVRVCHFDVKVSVCSVAIAAVAATSSTTSAVATVAGTPAADGRGRRSCTRVDFRSLATGHSSQHKH